ncbi:MAG: hypothetical protein WKF66_18490 [Pedobacter sp.]
MKTSKNEQKTSSNYPSSSSSFKKLSHYFHPDDDFRIDHSWGSTSTVDSKSAKSTQLHSKHNRQ